MYQICEFCSFSPKLKPVANAQFNTARKYRDEPRPRQGLLRGREFVMKDLYTFDYNAEEALKTYDLVRRAYTRLFDELKIPYLVAAADSGNMGGNLSHEFHFPSSKGEDTIISCSNCDHVYNEELANGQAPETEPEKLKENNPKDETSALGSDGPPAISTGLWMAISRDRKTLVRGWYPKYLMQEGSIEPVEREVNSHAVKAITNAAGLDLDLSVENPLQQWLAELKQAGNSERPKVLDLYDSQVRVYKRPPLSDLLHEVDKVDTDIEYSMLDRFPGTTKRLQLVRVHDGDKCPRCEKGTLKSQTAIELGHTFHLGARYSEVLQASVAVDSALLGGGDSDKPSSSTSKTQIVPMQMGCHGIGVSRMISAVADMLSDSKGLNWPRAMAPYEVVVVPAKGLEADAEKVYDALASDKDAPLDVVLDDRDKQIGWKLGDADLIGYPVIVVVGKGWKNQRTLEVQCRRLDNLREEVPFDRLSEFVRSLLDRL